MTYEIRDTRLSDIRALANTMRDQDRAEILGWGLVPRHLLHHLYRESPIKQTALVDGEVAAVWGCQGAVLGGDADPWLFTAPAILRAKRGFFREARRIIGEMLAVHPRLRFYGLASYSESIRLFERMGFVAGPPEPLGVNGTEYRLMTIERPKPDRRPFVIYGLPRSRTYWLSRFLSYGDWECWHEPAQQFRGVDDIRSWLSQDCTGAADTSASSWWRTVQRYRPDARILVVRRPVGEVVDSLMRLDMRGVCAFDRVALTRQMTRLDRKLDQIERRVAGVLSVNFSDIENETTCARIFEHCLPYAHDPDWWARNAAFNLQADMPALMRYQSAHRTQIDRLVTLCREDTVTTMRATRHGPADRSAVTIQQEPFEAFWRDGQELFVEHAAEVGGREGVILRPNVPLAERLEEARAVQIVTARYRGRMVGYLVVLIGPSLEDIDLVSATQNTFFVTRAFRGIGFRLLRFAIDGLRKRNVGEVILRAGVRGDGRRLTAMFERLGAKEYGHLYNIMLRAA